MNVLACPPVAVRSFPPRAHHATKSFRHLHAICKNSLRSSVTSVLSQFYDSHLRLISNNTSTELHRGAKVRIAPHGTWYLQHAECTEMQVHTILKLHYRIESLCSVSARAQTVMSGSLEGGCLCRAVRYRIQDRNDLIYSVLCHCKNCRKASGSQVVCASIFPAEVRWDILLPWRTNWY